MTPAGRKSRKIERDVAVLRDFIGAFCRQEHGRRGELCDSCRELFEYSAQRRRGCKLDPKPRCSSCEIHCYTEPYCTRIRQAMRAGAAYYVRHWRVGRLLAFAVGSLKDRFLKTTTL